MFRCSYCLCCSRLMGLFFFWCLNYDFTFLMGIHQNIWIKIELQFLFNNGVSEDVVFLFYAILMYNWSTINCICIKCKFDEFWHMYNSWIHQHSQDKEHFRCPPEFPGAPQNLFLLPPLTPSPPLNNHWSALYHYR